MYHMSNHSTLDSPAVQSARGKEHSFPFCNCSKASEAAAHSSSRFIHHFMLPAPILSPFPQKKNYHNLFLLVSTREGGKKWCFVFKLTEDKKLFLQHFQSSNLWYKFYALQLLSLHATGCF